MTSYQAVGIAEGFEQADSEEQVLDALYNAVERLQVHGCDLDYIKAEVETAYQFQSERTPIKEAGKGTR